MDAILCDSTGSPGSTGMRPSGIVTIPLGRIPALPRSGFVPGPALRAQTFSNTMRSTV